VKYSTTWRLFHVSQGCPRKMNAVRQTVVRPLFDALGRVTFFPSLVLLDFPSGERCAFRWLDMLWDSTLEVIAVEWQTRLVVFLTAFAQSSDVVGDGWSPARARAAVPKRGWSRCQVVGGSEAPTSSLQGRREALWSAPDDLIQ